MSMPRLDLIESLVACTEVERERLFLQNLLSRQSIADVRNNFVIFLIYSHTRQSYIDLGFFVVKLYFEFTMSILNE